jgi:hypothetical protein
MSLFSNIMKVDGALLNDLNEDQTYVVNISQQEEKQRIKEKIHIKNYINMDICRYVDVKIIKRTVDYIDIPRMFEILNEVVYDTDSQRAASCVIRAITYNYNDEGEIFSRAVRIKNFIKNLKLIKRSNLKNLFIAQLRDTEKYELLVKTNTRDNSFVLHEFFVGIKCLNHLRSLIPNFIYTYGAIACTLPLFDDDYNVTSFMAKDEDETIPKYVILEGCKGDILEMRLKNCSYDEFMNYYFQILCSLAIAHDRYNFTHYNLLCSNVILRRINYDEFFIKYNRGYLKCSKIATIIDFSYAHVNYDATDYGVFNEEGIRHSLSNIIGDAYQLLMSSLDKMNELGNHVCFERCKRLREFFSNETLILKIINAERKHHFRLPYQTKDVKFFQVSIDAYISWIIKNFKINPFLKQTESILPVLTCAADQSCYTSERFFTNIGLKNDILDTVPKFFSVYHKTINPQVKKKILDKFNYKDILPPFIKNINYTLIELIKKINMIKSFSLVDAGANTIFNDVTLTSFQRFISQVSFLYDEVIVLRSEIESAEFVSEIYQLKNFKSELELTRREYNGLVKRLKDMIDDINDSITHVDDVRDKYKEKFQANLIKNERFLFHYNQMKLFEFITNKN